MKTLKLAILPVALLATSAFAHEAESGIVKNSTTQLVEGTKTFFNKATKPGAISAEVGTLGYGGHITWGVNEKIDLVAGWNGGKTDFDVDIGDPDSIINWKKVLDDKMKDYTANLEFKADMNNPYLGVRLRPWGNNFNIGTGVILNDNTFSATLKNTTSVKYEAPKDITFTVPEDIKYEYAGKTYEFKAGEVITYKKGDDIEVPADASISVSSEQRNSVAPYLTIGFAPSTNKRWGFFGEVGVAYTGNLKTDVNYSIPEVLKNTPTEHDVKEIAEDIRKEVRDANVKFQPIVKAGVTVRF